MKTPVVLSSRLVFRAIAVAAVLSVNFTEAPEACAKEKKPTNQQESRVKHKEAVKLSIKDPECQSFAPSAMAWDGFSASQKSSFEEAYRLEKESRLTEAVRKYRELSTQVNSFQLLYNLGVAEAASGNLASAEADLKRSAQANPHNRATFKLLSQVQSALGKEAEARYSMDKYLQL